MTDLYPSSGELETVPLVEIVIQDRSRKEYKHLEQLSESISRVGLLHPVICNQDMVLIAGGRRIEAVKRLGWKTIAVRRVSNLKAATDALVAERDENTCRDPLTPTEMSSLAKRLKEIEGTKAAERKAATQAKTGNDGKRPTGGAESAPPVNPRKNRKTRDAVAEAVGTSHDTLSKIDEVVEAAEKEPEVYGDLPAKMDETGKVDPAHKEMRERRAKKEKDPLQSASETFCGKVNQLTRSIDSIVRECTDMKSDPLGFDTHWDSIVSQLQAARKALHIGRTKFRCPYCKGSGSDCKTCRATGYLGKSKYISGCKAVGVPAEEGDDE